MKRFLLLSCVLASASHAETLVVGSKAFTESVILAELATQLLATEGVPAEHRKDIGGGSQVLWKGLLSGQIELYPEYTGTLTKDLIPEAAHDDETTLRARLEKLGLGMTRPLGFNNTYAIGMPRALAEKLSIKTISDLKKHPELRFGFSHEFMDRAEGWSSLRSAYELPQSEIHALDHDIAYRAIAQGTVDAVDLFATDAEIKYYNLIALEDDLRHFPEYKAFYLYRLSAAKKYPTMTTILARLEGSFTQESIVNLNARAKIDKVPESEVASAYLNSTMHEHSTAHERSRFAEVWARVREHLSMVAISLAAAILVALPLGVFAAKFERAGQVILGTLGVIQTIPSLALLVFMIPLLGIGSKPAIVALFLYSLLPIVRNTATGLRDIPASVRESAEALGLTPLARLMRVELPMASRAILAGIKTSAVINVGTATLGALIGAGGLGQPILVGIRRDDLTLILEGAVPAAALALLVQIVFEGAERFLVPRGLRVK